MASTIMTADIHFGVQGKTKDILWSCRVIREYAKYANIKIVKILGDLFHDRVNLNIDILNIVTDFFIETKEQYGQEWIVFPGNHDMFLRHSWDITSIKPLQKYLTVIQDIKIIQIENTRFWIIPFVTYEKSFMKLLHAVEKQVQDNDILLTHIGVRGATLNTCFMLKDWSIVTFEYSKFKKVYTGHFHTRQQIGENVWYPGSPIPFKFDEGDVSHGFYVYDLESNTHRFINIWKAGEKFFPDEIPPPQYHTITADQIEQLKLEDIKNNIIRIILDTDYTDEQKRVLTDCLYDQEARIVRFMNLAKKQENITQIESAELTQRNLFASWIENDVKGTKDLNRSLLKQANDDIVHDGDELYSIEESEL